MSESAVPLSESDHLMLHSAVREIYRTLDLAAFPKVALRALRELVPALSSPTMN
jgi:hypothetical protein